ncbi:hypothetical protein AMJ40_03510 [candidate division TA06 bacterium DG_26]|uniref:Dockerin domain-containing protein n=1 Tax=candidate division TA06 bacterium DG_26 TaxID=1703771 RepID=A0A0S7WJ82_UNCT6|nr:MAG: hypothetical protein AMJ40_03510 [candidate division TA06 bacterium DG_26]
MTLDDFKRRVLSARESFQSDPQKIKVSERLSNGLDIVFNCDGTVPAPALVALASVATYIESVFTDSVTVSIDIGFADLGSGVLGATGIYFISSHPSWTTTHTCLISDMDSDDIVQNWLPAGSTIPVRYDAGSPTVTDENRCRFAKANYGAVIGSISGKSAEIEFNNTISWDYDPSDGVTGYCFQSVAAHEIGHAIGFVSRAEEWYQPNADILCLDIFRFQYSDYNPDTYAEFSTTPRLVDYNNPNNDHYSDIISAEHWMCDGYPYQASHFRPGFVYGVMLPAIGTGTTFYPDFYKTADLDMFDAIGWNYSQGQPPNELPYPPNSPSPDSGATDVEREADIAWLGGDPDPGDIVTYDVYFEPNDPTPDSVVSAAQYDTYYDPGTLEYATEYYWKIVAHDNHGASTEGPIWNFTTQANLPPHEPGNPYPPDEATEVGVEANLVWTGGDPDPADTVTYDVYFEAGDSTPDELVSEAQSETSYNPGALEYGATYYWQIVSGDNHAHTVEGPIWSFTTLAYACGDCNADGRVTVADATYLVSYIYREGPAPIGPGDVNLDGRITVADATYIVSYVYRGGPPPCEPTRQVRNPRTQR